MEEDEVMTTAAAEVWVGNDAFTPVIDQSYAQTGIRPMSEAGLQKRHMDWDERPYDATAENARQERSDQRYFWQEVFRRLNEQGFTVDQAIEGASKALTAYKAI